MAYDAFSTRVMLDAIEQMQPRAEFLGNSFFPKVVLKQGEYVDVDVIKENSEVATYADYNDEATLVEKPTRTMQSVKIPQISLKTPLTAADLLQRPLGQNQYSGLQNEAEEINRQLKFLMNMVYRSVELQASQALQTGVITLTGKGVSHTITFGRDGALTYTIGGTKWDTAGSDPLGDLQTLCDLIFNKSGKVPDRVVMGQTAIKSFLSNATVMAQLNTLQARFADLKPGTLDEGSAYIGKVFTAGYTLDVYSYANKYKLNGSSYNYVDAKKVIVGSTTAKNNQVYGAIRDIKAKMQAAQFFPKIWEENDPSCIWLGMKSSPVLLMSEMDATGCIQVIA